MKDKAKTIELDPIVVAVSSRALFNLEVEHHIFEKDGFLAYRKYQTDNREEILEPGVAFPFVKQFLALNDIFGVENRFFRVVTLSRNSPETAYRFFNSCKHYHLPITAGAFTSGQSTFPYLKAFNVSLFLSANIQTVQLAIHSGLAAGLVLPNKIKKLNEGSTLRIAFDFDGVLVDDEAEREFQTRGLTGFNKLEAAKAHTPHSPGPLSNLFARLSEIQKLDFELHGKSNPYYQPAIRISIVTSRGTPSEERLITTLKSLGMSAAELFLLDGLDKAPILEALQPHIFFDDQIKHLTSTQIHIPSVLVPFGIHNQD